MSRYSSTYPRIVSAVMSGHASAKIALSGNPVIEPTRSKSSALPPCVSMTRFAVSTTKRTLSVSVPSRSQSTARMRGRASATAAARRSGGSGLDPEHGLLRDAAVACLLAPAHERLELVVQGLGVLQTGVDDLEAQVAHRIAFRETLQHHLADPLRCDFGRAA